MTHLPRCSHEATQGDPGPRTWCRRATSRDVHWYIRDAANERALHRFPPFILTRTPNQPRSSNMTAMMRGYLIDDEGLQELVKEKKLYGLARAVTWIVKDLGLYPAARHGIARVDGKKCYGIMLGSNIPSDHFMSIDRLSISDEDLKRLKDYLGTDLEPEWYPKYYQN
ncbi:hypothetical protein BV25DRAFT_1902175 [Artomyces pyxidatus]|uniref:Uncharacterized protein n=1 Tax=Artomyces pyxidatus TaxID=48021 RepID=A0ACB8SPP4_9AGAM|nr:hypothetical protein BV25DRAFT_1902175 [Artomyces pyxidatus]